MVGEDLSSTDLHLANGDTLLVGQVAELAQIDANNVDVANRLHVRKLQVINYCCYCTNVVTVCTYNSSDQIISNLFATKKSRMKYKEQGVALKGRNTTGPPRAVPW